MRRCLDRKKVKRGEAGPMSAKDEERPEKPTSPHDLLGRLRHCLPSHVAPVSPHLPPTVCLVDRLGRSLRRSETTAFPTVGGSGGAFSFHKSAAGSPRPWNCLSIPRNGSCLQLYSHRFERISS